MIIRSSHFAPHLDYLQTHLRKLKNCAEQTRSVHSITLLPHRPILLRKHFTLLKFLIILLKLLMEVSQVNMYFFYVFEFQNF